VNRLLENMAAVATKLFILNENIFSPETELVGSRVEHNSLESANASNDSDVTVGVNDNGAGVHRGG
jgi:hypothetical protein